MIVSSPHSPHARRLHLMRVTKIILLVIGVLAGIIAIVVTFAVARERDSLAGDALARSPEAIAYAAAQAKALRAAGVQATDRMLQLRDPAMRAHAYESGTGAASVVFIHGGGSSAVV